MSLVIRWLIMYLVAEVGVTRSARMGERRYSFTLPTVDIHLANRNSSRINESNVNLRNDTSGTFCFLQSLKGKTSGESVANKSRRHTVGYIWIFIVWRFLFTVTPKMLQCLRCKVEVNPCPKANHKTRKPCKWKEDKPKYISLGCCHQNHDVEELGQRNTRQHSWFNRVKGKSLSLISHIVFFLCLKVGSPWRYPQ